MAQNVNPISEHSDQHMASNNDSKEGDEMRVPQSEGQAVTKRLHKDLMTLMMSSDKNLSAFPNGDNFFNWIGTIAGPKDSVYENLKYKLSLTFPSSYPFTAPLVKFITPCFHPNIDKMGNICLDILKDNWAPSYDVRTILLSIQALLGEPNVNSPLNALAAETWKDKEIYKQHVLDMHRDV